MGDNRSLPLVLLGCALMLSASGAPIGEHSPEVSKAIGLIHHLTYLIDYLVQYVIRDEDRKTPQDAVDFYQQALVQGKARGTAPGGAEEYKPSADRARQETEIINKMMKV